VKSVNVVVSGDKSASKSVVISGRKLQGKGANIVITKGKGASTPAPAPVPAPAPRQAAPAPAPAAGKGVVITKSVPTFTKNIAIGKGL